LSESGTRCIVDRIIGVPPSRRALPRPLFFREFPPPEARVQGKEQDSEGAMTPAFYIGCNGRGAQASSRTRPVSLEEPSIDEQFRLVKESGAFDYFDRLPLHSNFDEYRRAITKYDLPVRSASWFYRLGQDEALLSANLRVAKEIGAAMHNIMIYTCHADGHIVTDDESGRC